MVRPTADSQEHDRKRAASLRDPGRRRAAAALSRLLTGILSPAARRRGFAAVAVIEQWSSIVGGGLAQRCHPVRLDFRRGAREGGTLVLQASGGAALELQHAAPQLIERINDYFGFRAVARLHLVQMPPRRPTISPQLPARRQLTTDEAAALAATVAPLANTPLGIALSSLGHSIKSRQTIETHEVAA